MTAQSSEQSRKYLQKLGVEVITGTVVKDYDGKTVTLTNGNTIATNTVIWAAGIKGNIPAGIQPALVAKGNRIKTDRHNLVLGTDNVFAIGDVAYMETPLFPKGHPQVAQTAMQQADTLAENLVRIESKSSTRYEFEYYDKGSMATVGRNLAVVDLPKPKMHFGGFIAWMIWMGLHLMLILGVKNKFFVFCNWVYNYITRDQSLRLIFKGITDKPKPVKMADV